MEQLDRPSVQNPFSIDAESDLPVGVQLTWRLRALIVAGRLLAGDPLPSARLLAVWAGVNVNTVRAVYAGLEKDGLVISRQGQGTFVATDVEAAPQLEQIAADALRRAREAGLSPRDLAIVATACVSIPEGDEKTEGPAIEQRVDLPGLSIEEGGEAIAVRHELRRQIARLEAELAFYTRDLPADLATAHRFAEGHLLSVEELERTRDTLIAKLSEAQKTAALRAKQEDESRLRREAMLQADRPRAPAEQGPLDAATRWWRPSS